MRGARARSLPILIRDLVAKYRFQIFVLLEPQISESKAQVVNKKLPFHNSYVVPTHGFLGVFGCYGMRHVLLLMF